MAELGELIQAHVTALSRARADALETACERAIQQGRSGVMVESGSAWVDERVPYGEIWDVTACGADGVRI